MKIRITTGGDIMFIWDDRLSGLLRQGDSKIERASNVEPTKDGKWSADLSPTFPGVIFGPFEKRREAIDAEIEFLENNLGKIRAVHPQR